MSWVAFFVTIGIVLAYWAVPTILSPFLTPLRTLVGPPSRSWFWGHVKDELFEDDGSTLLKWSARYGHVFRFKMLMNIDSVVTTDSKALSYILTNYDGYSKPVIARAFLTKLMGNGILVAEGERFRKQRKIMNPAFGPAQIRELMDVFLGKATQLRDIWATAVEEKGGEFGARIDVLPGLSRAALDIIGLAGFGYEFNALNSSGQVNPLSQALGQILGSTTQPSILNTILDFIPAFQIIPTKRQAERNAARETMMRIGRELVRAKRAAIQASSMNIDSSVKDFDGKDLLTLLMKGNMAAEIPESQRLSDEEVIAQIPTFFVAGHESTASSLSWCLYALALDKRVQQKLREELLSIPTDSPCMDDLMSLPYLDAVTRETLRLHPVVVSMMRQATKDDCIPLDKPFIDKYGKYHDTIQIRAGDQITIPIASINKLEQFWGEDASEFKPERWDNIPETASGIQGVWSNIFTFSGGPRACIGWRFALVEFKAIMFTLLRAFEFELAVPPEDIIRRTGVVMRPIVRSEVDKGNQLPLLVMPLRR